MEDVGGRLHDGRKRELVVERQANRRVKEKGGCWKAAVPPSTPNTRPSPPTPGEVSRHAKQHSPGNFTHEYIIIPTISITIRFVPSALKYIIVVARNGVGNRSTMSVFEGVGECVFRCYGVHGVAGYRIFIIMLINLGIRFIITLLLREKKLFPYA